MIVLYHLKRGRLIKRNRLWQNRHTEKAIKAPLSSYIICNNLAPIVNQGDALFHITTEAKAL